jgi:hypothetical protein
VKVLQGRETLSFGALSADGAFLVACCWKSDLQEGVVRVVDCYTGAATEPFVASSGLRVSRAAINDDGKRLVLAVDDGSIRSVQI